MSKKSQLHFRGPLQAYPMADAQHALGYVTTPPRPLTVWLCVKTVNTVRLNCNDLTYASEFRDLVELDPADVTVLAPTGSHGDVYVGADEWHRLGGPLGPEYVYGRNEERPSERAMRLSEGKAKRGGG